MKIVNLSVAATLTAMLLSVNASNVFASSAEEKPVQNAAEAEVAAATTDSVVEAAEEAADTDEPMYVVVDGMVDKATFNGYRRFHGTCHACHGQNAVGSSFAPSLVDSLKTMTYAEFIQTVTDGRTITKADGSQSAMPPFKEDPNVMKHIDDLYRYVKARADDAVATGRPKKIKVPK